MPLLLLWLKLDHLTVLSLAALIAGSAAGYGLLLYLVVLERDERARINQLLKTRLGFAQRRGVAGPGSPTGRS